MPSKRELILTGVLTTLTVGFVLMRGCDKRKDRSVSSTVLAPNVVEKIIVDPSTHALTVVTKDKQSKLFLPDRPSSIELDKEGHITVTSRQWGTEIRPFMGMGYADKLRLYGGIDLGYWKKLDGGLFLSGGPSAALRFGAGVSYTLRSNTRLSLGVDNARNVNIFVSVRL